MDQTQASKAGPLLPLILHRVLYGLGPVLSGVPNGPDGWLLFHSVGPGWAAGPGYMHLCPFIQEGIPDSQEDVTDERVGKDHEEPVEGDEREVDAVLPQVCGQSGQLL